MKPAAATPGSRKLPETFWGHMFDVIVGKNIKLTGGSYVL